MDAPVKVRDQLHTMACAYVFAVLALISLDAVHAPGKPADSHNGTT
jgi:hypothetical protein